MSLVFFDHDVYCVAPASQNVTVVNDKVEEFCEAGQKSVVLDESFVVSKMSA